MALPRQMTARTGPVSRLVSKSECQRGRGYGRSDSRLQLHLLDRRGNQHVAVAWPHDPAVRCLLREIWLEARELWSGRGLGNKHDQHDSRLCVGANSRSTMGIEVWRVLAHSARSERTGVKRLRSRTCFLWPEQSTIYRRAESGGCAEKRGAPTGHADAGTNCRGQRTGR